VREICAFEKFLEKAGPVYMGPNPGKIDMTLLYKVLDDNQTHVL
jgi:hypothetical protein